MASPYDDPLNAGHPGCGAAHPLTYWQATAGPGPEDDGSLDGDREVDVAVIGAGYTGLSCAYHLAHRYGIRALVLEANRPGWGCSGRNGSFARPAIGRLAYAQWIRRWGKEDARAMFAESLAALETVRELIRAGAIDCDAQPDGWLKLAHRPSRVADLKAEHHLLRDAFGFETAFLDRNELAAAHVRGGEAFAALRWPISFAMHPMKLAYGLLRMARDVGASVHSASPVIELSGTDGRHALTTPRGRVTAREVVIATNGYTLESILTPLRGRLLPVLSNIVVTEPLTREELAEGNFVTTDAMSDTRSMLYYYRRLPDNRIMLGGRGPLRETTRAMRAHEAHLIDAIRRKFPFVRAPRAEYLWGGWVAVTADHVPHVATVEDSPTLHYALGYMGSGVSFSMHAGKRIAERIGGEPVALPTQISQSLPRFPFAAFRRLGQRLMTHWYASADARD